VPLSDDKRSRVVELVRGGMGRNAVAKEVGISGRTVSIIAAKEGLSFDREASAKATEARKEDAKARRSTLGVAMLGDLEEARLRLAKTETARDFQATAQGMDALTRAYTALVKLEPDDGGLGEARGMVGSILGAIRDSVHGVPRMNESNPPAN
jgi:hypothetical protein